jgi:LDH2 family malate/lactate/ureidoglycolate dehydrogenase
VNAAPSIPLVSSVVAEVPLLDAFCRAILSAAGADEATADAATRAMMHGSLLGVDSHGVRLLDHYVTVLTHGRVNSRPRLRFVLEQGATAVLDADHGHGALATYAAMARAVEIARAMGLGAIAIRNTSHLGPAGAYALAAAEAGMIGIVLCNSDSFVRLHDGASRFHGTNPIACAVPVSGSTPWLLDMATSAITYNRLLLCRSLGLKLPPGVASGSNGEDTDDPEQAAMLAPLGGAYGYKGAGLAGLVEIFSAVVTGMKLSFDLLPMSGPDFTTPRGLGAFVLAVRPDAFVDSDTFRRGMERYLHALRHAPARPDGRVMAPGDREWAEAVRRQQAGVPLDPETVEGFRRLGARYGVPLPFANHVE